MRKRRSILSTDLYRQDSLFLAQAFDQALERRDGRELTQILIMASDLIRQLLKTLKSKYGGHISMGARKSKWDGWLPQDVMADLRNAVEIDGEWVKRAKITIKVPGLSKGARNIAKDATKRLERYLRERIRSGRKWINDRWPGWWTPDVEGYFEDWL